MKIGEIEIPDSEIEKLSPAKKRVFYCLYQAYLDGRRGTGAITTHTISKAGGTGFSARVQNLRDEILDKYGLTILCKEYGKWEGRTIFAYWIAPKGSLPMIPKEVFGDV